MKELNYKQKKTKKWRPTKNYASARLFSDISKVSKISFEIKVVSYISFGNLFKLVWYFRPRKKIRWISSFSLIWNTYFRSPGGNHTLSSNLSTEEREREVEKKETKKNFCFPIIPRCFADEKGLKYLLHNAFQPSVWNFFFCHTAIYIHQFK